MKYLLVYLICTLVAISALYSNQNNSIYSKYSFSETTLAVSEKYDKVFLSSTNSIIVLDQTSYHILDVYYYDMPIIVFELSMDEEFIVISSLLKYKIINTKDMSILHDRVYPEQIQGIDKINIKKDNSKLLVSNRRNVWNIDIETGDLDFNIQDHGTNLCKFTPDGSKIISDQGGWVKAYDSQSGEFLYNLAYHHITFYNNNIFSDDSKYMTTVDYNGFIKTYNLNTAEMLDSNRIPHVFSIFDIKDSHEYMFVKGNPSKVYTRDPEEGEIIDSFQTLNPPRKLYMDYNRNKLLTLEYGQFRVYDLDDHQLINEINNDPSISGVNWNIDENKLIILRGYNKTELFNPFTGEVVENSPFYSLPINSIEFSKDKSKYAYYNSTKGFYLVDIENEFEERNIDNIDTWSDERFSPSLSFSFDNKILCSYPNDFTSFLHLWDLETFDISYLPLMGDYDVKDIEFAPNDKELVVSLIESLPDTNKFIFIYDIENRNVSDTIKINSNYPSIVWNRDYSMFVYGSTDTELSTYNMQTSEIKVVANLRSPLRADLVSDQLTGTIILPQQDGFTVIDNEKFNLISEFWKENISLNSLSISPGSKYLAFSNMSSDIFIYPFYIFNNLNEEATHFNVYPNPFNDQLTITNYQCPMTNDQCPIEILDLMGNVVHQEKITLHSSLYTLNLEALLPGTYFVKIGERVEKVVKN